jgi:hypothetical protein
MPLGSFKLNGLAKFRVTAAAARSWDKYNGSADSAEFELTTVDTDGIGSCVVDGRLLVCHMLNSSPSTMNVRLFTIGSTPGSYSMTETANTTFTSPTGILPRTIRMAKLDTDKVILIYGSNFGNYYTYSRIITTTSGALSIGANNTINTGTEQNMPAAGNHLVVMSTTKVLHNAGATNPFRNINLITVSGNTVSLTNSYTPSGAAPPYFMSKIDSNTALVAWQSNFDGTGVNEALTAQVISISGGSTITAVSTSTNAVRPSTNNFYNWTKTNSWSEQLVDEGKLVVDSRTFNSGRSSQTKFFPGYTVMSATSGGTITTEGVGNTVALELDPVKDASGDYTSAGPFPTSENSIVCNVRSNYYLAMFRMMNNNNSNLDQAYYEIHVLKNDSGNLINPTDGSYSPQSIYSKPNNNYLFGFDQFYCHRVDNDTAIAVFAKGRNATAAPNGKLACKIIKAPT